MNNKELWTAIANQFGLELTEEFKVNDGDLTRSSIYRFSENGVESYWPPTKEWINVNVTETQLLHNKFTVIKLPWKPKDGDSYYCISLAVEPHVVKPCWEGDTYDIEMYSNCNCFKTREEAEAKLKRIKGVLQSD